MHGSLCNITQLNSSTNNTEDSNHSSKNYDNYDTLDDDNENIDDIESASFLFSLPSTSFYKVKSNNSSCCSAFSAYQISSKNNSKQKLNSNEISGFSTLPTEFRRNLKDGLFNFNSFDNEKDRATKSVLNN